MTGKIWGSSEDNPDLDILVTNETVSGTDYDSCLKKLKSKVGNRKTMDDSFEIGGNETELYMSVKTLLHPGVGKGDSV